MDARQFVDAKAARMMRGLVTLDFDLTTAIVNQVINSPGNTFYLDKQSTGICYVQGNTDQGYNDSPLLASPGFALYDEAGFSGFRFSSPAQPGKVLRVVIASGMTIKPGDPVQSGAVATPTVDAGLARTNSGQAFMAAGFVAAVAAQYSHLQLWNPVAATKRLIVSKMSASSVTAPVTVSAWLYNTALAVHANSGVSKLSGNPAAISEVRSENNVGLLGTSSLITDYLAVNDRGVWEFREPIVLPPGFGVLIRAQPVNVSLVANFEWIEQ